MTNQNTCPDCGVAVGEPHQNECGVERCSVCGCHRICCDCENHDPQVSAWMGTPNADVNDDLTDEDDFLSQLGGVENRQDVQTGDLVRHPSTEDFEIGGEPYQWWNYDNGDSYLFWWNGYGIAMGVVFQEDNTICAAARLDRRDDGSEGVAIIGSYRTALAARRAVIEALKDRWHTLPNWLSEGF